MQFFYTLVIYLLSPFVLLRLFYLGRKKPEYRTRWQERFGHILWQKPEQKIIWVHAVSVGEVNASKQLIRFLLDNYKNYRVLITTVTPTGAYTVQQHFADDVHHLYFPYDLPFVVKRFLKTVQPVIFMSMETEIWPNLFTACKNAQVPILIINARLSEKSARGYQRLSSLTKETLSLIDVIAAQTQADADRFINIGASGEKVVVTGNLKFDITIPVSINEQAQSLKRYLSVNRPVWIAASTQPGEEEIILKAHRMVLNEKPDAILILAPRHPERIDKVAEMCKNYNFEYVKRSEHNTFTDKHSIYLVDTLGELQLHYAAAQVAFVGGSLVNTGGQNMMEPASLGLPIICGPYTYNFTEITELLSEKKAIKVVANDQDLSKQVCAFFIDANARHLFGEKAREVVNDNKGNLNKITELIGSYL